MLQCETVETTAIGAAYLAGLAVGYWEDLEELEQNAQIVRTFLPHMSAERREQNLAGWRDAAMRDLPMEDVEVETPITTATFKQLAGKKLAIVPILRAGLGMVDGILDLVPSARVGHIGMERDEVTHEPHEYYCKMPKDIDQRICLVVDPMLATGGSAEMAISYLRERGVKDIRMLCIVAAPEGLKSLTEKDSDVHIYTCAIDDHLNEAAYIVPGLGDAGDRIYGTL